MRTYLITASTVLAVGLLLSSCGGGGHDQAAMDAHAAMMKADSAAKAALAANEAGVKAVVEILNTGNMDKIGDHVAENFVDHQQDPSITTTGIQGLKDMIGLVRGAYPDFNQEVISMSTTGDMTFVHFRMKGTNTGPWGVMPATGKAMDVMGVDIMRFENGKAVEHWGYMEEMKMMTQLGMMPEPGAEAKK
ncbi:MAG: ester cyclase [Flavobacteriales bacterium]|nr:ester cyclase [Flavobacteriales bacterium]